MILSVRNIIGGGFVLAAAVLAGVLIGRPPHDPVTRAASPACTNSDTVKCPNPVFLEQENQFDALGAEVGKMQFDPSASSLKLQSLTDQLNGMYMRLHQEYPSGFDWDDSTKHFVKITAPAGPAPTQAPVKK
jgi:hypothetical protein